MGIVSCVVGMGESDRVNSDEGGDVSGDGWGDCVVLGVSICV